MRFLQTYQTDRFLKRKAGAIFIYALAMIAWLFMEPAWHLAEAGLARDLAEAVLRKAGKQSDDLAVRELEQQFVKLFNRLGPDCEPFLKRFGKDGAEILERAGQKGNQLLKWYQSAPGPSFYLLRDKEKLEWTLQYGKTAFDAMIRHPGAAEVLIRKHGAQGAAWALNLDRNSVLKLAKLETSGWTSRHFPDSKTLSDFVRNQGSAGIKFIWKHRTRLAAAGALTWFMTDPESFINGTRSLMQPTLSQIWDRTTGSQKLYTILLLLIFGGYLLMKLSWIVKTPQWIFKKLFRRHQTNPPINP